MGWFLTDVYGRGFPSLNVSIPTLSFDGGISIGKIIKAKRCFPPSNKERKH
jgi:hypothetical protein